MTTVDNLKMKLNSVSGNISKNHWKYFHKQSITNFILNLPLIKLETEREKISETILECLNDVESNFEANIDYSIYLYNSYLKYIVPTYENQLGFWPIANKNALIFYSIVIIIVFIVLIEYAILEILYCAILVLFIYKMYVLFKKHKVFGFRY